MIPSPLGVVAAATMACPNHPMVPDSEFPLLVAGPQHPFDQSPGFVGADLLPSAADMAGIL